jgi:hypothetical protein
MEAENITAALAQITELAQAHRAEIRSTMAENRNEQGYLITFTAEFPGMGSKRRREQFFTALAASSKVHSIHRSTEVIGSKHMKG